jgi:hypothetical protein
MKFLLIFTITGTLLSFAACTKDHYPAHKDRIALRKVRFELYTTEDFSGDKLNIQFTLHMHNDDRSIYDSSLATMRVEEIPDSLHRIIIEKFVPGNDTSTLVVGFTYHIQNVGYSWYLEEFPGRDSLKVLRYSFK